MTDKKFNLDFYARVKTDIDSVNDVISSLKNQLNSLEIPKNAGKGLEKSLGHLVDEIQNFETLAKRGVSDLSDTKKLNSSWKKITDHLTTIGSQITDLKGIGDKIFPKEVLANIEKADKALEKYTAKIESIKKSKPYTDKLEERRQAGVKSTEAKKAYERESSKYETQKTKVQNDRDAWEQNRAAEYAAQLQKIAEINAKLEEQKKIQKDLLAIQDQLREAGVVTKQGDITSSHRRELNKAKDIEGSFKGEVAKREKALQEAKDAEEKARRKVNAQKSAESRVKNNSNTSTEKTAEATQKRIEAEKAYQKAIEETAQKLRELEEARADYEKAQADTQKLQDQANQAKNIKEQIENSEAQSEALRKQAKATEEASEENKKIKKDLESSEAALKDQKIALENSEKAFEDAKTKVKLLDEELKKMETDGATIEWSELATVIKEVTGIDVSQFSGDVQQVLQVLQDYKAGKIEDLPELFNGILNSLNGANPAIKNFGEEINKAEDETKEFNTRVNEMESLKSRIFDFFSITSAVQLFRQAVRNAINTVKELDAVMTETAVVTDFTIGDMWDKLPEYSANATKLGASIKDLYSATTLYYQQGLQTEAAMSVGIETMKMARIANLDAADATQAMTAALRGFNMEVDEINAQRVNDVYSELAAITAADTGQIADAMTKTASIAHSANMEFETTAALLAQIIETTQEAPETAGTAMKTIIARFTEVKQLFNEGMLTGEDSEGEVVDINKIDAALRTVGISLKDFLNGSKGIDDIFLELAEKWDTLDLATQRYIATTAAGSRQQSRFIAMMSNYERTMELVTAANNSAGASQDQFDKTLDSLAAKTQKLNNAWAEFTMGLANNELLKFGVDILTGLLTIVNKFTDFLSGNNGIAKSLITLTLAITALNGTRTVLAKIFGSGLLRVVVESFDKIKNESQKTSIQLTKDTREGVVNGLEQAAAQATSIGWKIGQNAAKGINDGLQVNVTQPLSSEASISSYQQKPIAQTTSNQTLVSQPITKWEKVAANTSVQGLRLTGVLSTLIGVGLSWSATAVKAKDETSAFGQGLETAGATASIAGSTLSLLAPVLSTLGISIGALLGPIAIAVVSFGLLAAVMQNVHNNSPEGKLEQAEKAAERAGEAANNAAESFNNLNTALDSLDNKYKNLEELTRGTKEWNAAVHETNQEVLDLIEKYPALAAFVRSNGGVLTFDKKTENTQGQTYDDVYAGYEAAVGNSQIVKMKANANVEVAKQIKDFEDLELTGVTKEVFGKIAEEISLGNIEGFSYGEGKEENNAKVFNEYLKKQLEENPELANQIGLYGYDITDEYFQDAINSVAIDLGLLSDELVNWGSYLTVSKTKLEAYNKTLISQARDSSGIYDKELGNMAENFVTNEMFTRFEEESKKDPTKLTEQDYENYALNVLGGYYKDEKFYNAVGEVQEDITDEQVAQGLATVEATKKAAEAMTNFANKINNIKVSKDGKDFGIKNLYTKTQGQGLTLQDFQNFGLENSGQINTNKDEIEAVAKKLYNSNIELQESYGSIEEFVDYFINEVGLGAEYYNQTMDKLNQSWQGKGQEGIFGNQTQLDVGSIAKIVDELYAGFLVSGKKEADQFSAILQNIFNQISPEQAQKFADALGMIDWTNIDSIEKLNEYLIDFSFDATAAGIDIEDLEEKIKDFAKATKNINLESLKAEIKSLDELVESLADREETERVFSDEEKKALLKANPDMVNDFVMTGIDEWTYIGDSMGTLEEAVREATKAIWETYSEQTRKAGEKSQKWENLAEGSREYGNLSYAKIQEFAQSEEAVLSLGSVGLNNLKYQMSNMGMFGEGVTKEDIAKYTNQDIYEILSSQYQQYGAVAIRAENIANAQDAFASDHATAYYSDLSGQDILNAKNRYAGLEENEDAIARESALDAKLVTTDGLREEEEALRELNPALREYKTLTKAAVADAAAQRKQMSILAKVINDNEDALKDAAKTGAEYKEAVRKITVAAKDAFGNNITEEFVESNIDAFRDWAKGAEGSAERIQKALKEQAIATLDATKVNIESVTEKIKEIDNLPFSIEGHADFSEIFNELVKLLGSAEQAAAFIESMGYSLDWIPTYTISDGIVTLASYKAVISNTTGRARQSNAVNYGNSSNKSSSGDKPYENSFDKLYNLVREINEEVREMARLERRYEKLLKENDVSVGDLRDNLVDQLSQLYRQKFLNENLQTERRTQIQDYLAENSDLARYADIFQNERGEDVLRINWEQIDLVQDPDKGQRIEDYVDQLEEWMDGLDDIESELWDIEDQIEEIRNTGKQEYLDLEQALREAIEYSYQQEIDKLSQINDSINDTNVKLINSIQKQINKIRQDRENEKREEELADKQRQLLYLSQDTSGANDLSILRLQEEIDQGAQDYTDSLIDQKINELQEQNEDAAAQREKQIQLMQAQLDYSIKTGQIWDEVYLLIDEGLDKETGLIRGSQLETLLKNKDGFAGMSQLEKMEWLKELEQSTAMAAVFMSGIEEELIRKEFIQNIHYEMTIPEAAWSGGGGTSLGGLISSLKNLLEEDEDKKTIEEWNELRRQALERAELERLEAYKEYLLRLQSYEYSKKNKNSGTYKSPLYQYATGGLADFTGPAWLDGTKSRPEMVLNARDTQNFIQLKDILSSLLSRTSSTNNNSTENNGDITYDIDINVETMSSDYDVEQVANKVKSLINEDARYRNNNAVSLTR